VKPVMKFFLILTTASFLIAGLASITKAQLLPNITEVPCAPHDRIVGDYTKNGFEMFARGVTDGGRMHEMMRKDDIVILLVTYARKTMVSIGGGFTVPILPGGTCLHTVYEGWFIFNEKEGNDDA
jgi:hypothetical protein